jgi:hypothetical protein
MVLVHKNSLIQHIVPYMCTCSVNYNVVKSCTFLKKWKAFSFLK